MRKKIIQKIVIVAMVIFSFQSCAELTNVLLTNPLNVENVEPKSVISDIINSIMGSSPLREEEMYGKWKYNGTSVAFETENLWKKAGGKVAAYQVESKLNNTAKKLGLNSQNTYFVFYENRTYKAVILGIPLSGQYVLNAETKKVRLSYLMGLGSLNTTVVLAGNNMKIMIEADSILTLIKMTGKMMGNTYLKSLGEIAEMYDGMLLGFDLARYR